MVTLLLRSCPISKGVSLSEPVARLAVRNLEDLIGLVPFLIGFHPSESLVILVIEDGRVMVTARVDLADVGDPDGLGDLMGRLFARFGSAQAWCLAYSAHEETSWEVLGWCAALCGVMRLGRLVHVDGGRWRADTPDGPGGVVAAGPAAAEAAVLGFPVRASRHELTAQILGPDDDQTDALLAEFEAAVTTLAELSAADRLGQLRQLSRTAASRTDYVRLAVLAASREGQVSVLSELDQCSAAAAVDTWTAVIQHTLVSYLVGPLALLGVAAWLTGDGAMQTVCLERLDRIDRFDPLAAMLDWINATVLPPDQWLGYRDALVGALAAQDALLAVTGDPPGSRR
jgi:hypothetical protein